jgi:hypothetical protein
MERHQAKRWAVKLQLLGSYAVSVLVIAGAAGVSYAAEVAQLTTSQYNNARTGANLSEATLTPKNVNEILENFSP